MSSSLLVGKAFKVKAKHISAILDLPLALGQEYFSKILGYRDFDEARRAGLVVRELASQAHLRVRIREIVPGILDDKVEQIVNELNLPTADRVITQLRESSNLRTDVSRYFSSGGTFSDYYHQCLREVAPIFTKVHKLSAALGTFDRGEVDIPRVLAGLANLSKEDVDTALSFLSSCYTKYSDFLPVNVAMLVLQGAGTRRSTRLTARKTLAVFNEMLACVTAVSIPSQSYSQVRSELESYGLAIAAVQRSLGAHDVCLDILDGLARLYPSDTDRLDLMQRESIRSEAAFTALFARRFHIVPGLLPTTSNGCRIPSYPALAIEAIACAEIGNEQRATPLVDVLLCNPEVRLGLGLDNGDLIPRRRPEAMPLKSDPMELMYGDDLDRLRYLDLGAFRLARALFLKRDTYMREKLAASELTFKEFRVFPALRFIEKRDKHEAIFSTSISYTPAVARFGPASSDSHIDVVIIYCRDAGGVRWLMPPQLAQVFKGNAYFDRDPTCRRWLAHILSSGHVEHIKDNAGLRIKSGMGLQEKYRRGADLAWDEISFEIFRETERLEHSYSSDSKSKSISDDLASTLVEAYRESLLEHLQ